MSSNGKIIPHTPLAVDFWHVRKCPGARLFFLSHMHADHTVGLTSTWSGRPIYCSPVTAKLLHLKLKVKKQWIHPLEIGEQNLLPLDDIGKETLTVTLIDANHCPGAVMFLFQGYFGSILYTGDFRYSPSMLREPCLKNNITIDVLYLDDTNCDPNRTLPSRQKATQQIKEIIRSHPDHNVVIGLYTLGKESLLLELAKEFQTWVEVSYDRMETLKVLELPDVFTTEQGTGRFRVVDHSEITSASLQDWNNEQPTLAILPTSRPLISYHPSVHVVPYSDHSSYQEVVDFVSTLKPMSLIPIVRNHLPGSLLALVPHKKCCEIFIPESVRHYMLRQPERELSSSTNTFLRRTHLRAPTPRGVVFDSPLKGSRQACQDIWEADSLEKTGSEGEMDSESSERDSDCVVLDPSIRLIPDVSREGAEDSWNLSVVHTVSEDTVMAKSVPLCEFIQSNAAQTEISASTNVSLKSLPITKHQFKAKSKVFSHKRGHKAVQSSPALSDVDNLSLHSGNDSVILFHSSHDGASCTSSSSSTGLRERIEKLENRLLECLPFTEKDLRHTGLLSQSFIKMFSFSPLKYSEEDDL
uniref:5' exonuclease Apollo n=1 Tax=Oryzias latipes TaxID=8090 RepID=A0A3P9KNV0_ORYLA